MLINIDNLSLANTISSLDIMFTIYRYIYDLIYTITVLDIGLI